MSPTFSVKSGKISVDMDGVVELVRHLFDVGSELSRKYVNVEQALAIRKERIESGSRFPGYIYSSEACREFGRRFGSSTNYIDVEVTGSLEDVLGRDLFKWRAYGLAVTDGSPVGKQIIFGTTSQDGLIMLLRSFKKCRVSLMYFKIFLHKKFIEPEFKIIVDDVYGAGTWRKLVEHAALHHGSIPENLRPSSREEWLSLLSGIIDGDGFVKTYSSDPSRALFGVSCDINTPKGRAVYALLKAAEKEGLIKIAYVSAERCEIYLSTEYVKKKGILNELLKLICHPTRKERLELIVKRPSRILSIESLEDLANSMMIYYYPHKSMREICWSARSEARKEQVIKLLEKELGLKKGVDFKVRKHDICISRRDVLLKVGPKLLELCSNQEKKEKLKKLLQDLGYGADKKGRGSILDYLK